VRVPAGATPPETLTAEVEIVKTVPSSPQENTELGRRGAGGPTTKTITFTRSASLEEELPKWYDAAGPLAPVWDGEGLVRDGQQLAGYVSEVVDGAIAGDLEITGAFGLPDGPEAGKPYTGPFNHLSVLGSRWAGEEEDFAAFFSYFTGGQLIGSGRGTDFSLDPERDVDCSPTSIGGPARTLRAARTAARSMRGAERGVFLPDLEDLIFGFGQLDFTICDTARFLGGGVPVDENGVPIDPFAGEDLATRDLRVVGGEAFAEQGQTASVPFTVRGAGPEGGSLSYSATSAVAGATLGAPAADTFPGAGDHGRTVTVKVPADAAPGTYDVVLAVTSGKASREAKGKVVVLSKPAQQEQQQPQAGTPTPPAPLSPRQRERLYMDGEGDLNMGLLCGTNGLQCGSLRIDVLGPKAGIAPTATTAQVRKPRLLRIGRGSAKASAGQRSAAKAKLFPKARRALMRGRRITGLVVVRGRDGKPFVRRVVIARKK
jgi:hypothetical protein